MKKKLVLLMITLLAGICTGCQAEIKEKAVSEELKGFTEGFKECYLAQDTIAEAYTDSLESIEIYAAAPGEEGRLETIEILTEAYETIQQTEVPGCEFSADTERFLEEREISLAEFEALSAMGETDRERYLDDLEHYLTYLNSFTGLEDNISEAFLIEAEYLPQIQRELNEYMFYAANEILADLEEKELSYVRKEVIEELTVYCPKDVKWQDTKEEAFQKQEECWTRIEAIQEKLETEAGIYITQ